MAKTFYKAVHSSGTVHLRASSAGGSHYKFCVAGKGFDSASYCSRPDLAQKERDKQAKWGHAPEILPVVEISSIEHAALTRANQVTTTVVYRGKKFTTSRTIQQPPIVAVVGIYKAAYETRHELRENASEAERARFPDGFWINKQSEQFHIHTHYNLDCAKKTVAERITQGYETQLFEIANG
jgi:hypothetical protein